MLQIPEIVKYCHFAYAKGTPRCSNCNNAGCKGACTECFREIHFGNGRDYDCPNLMHHYVCTYIYAYSSEIWHIFNTERDLKNLDEYRILSIGCGPASELFGVSKIAGDKRIEYVGFDTNELWVNVHAKVVEMVNPEPNCTADIRIGNVFDNFGELNFNPNVIILSYLISHLIITNTDIEVFMKDFQEIILNNIPKPYSILINDINLNTVRDKFTILSNRLNADEAHIPRISIYSFDGYGYGIRHGSKRLIEDIPVKILSKYASWQKCKRTAQMLIKVN